MAVTLISFWIFLEGPGGSLVMCVYLGPRSAGAVLISLDLFVGYIQQGSAGARPLPAKLTGSQRPLTPFSAILGQWAWLGPSKPLRNVSRAYLQTPLLVDYFERVVCWDLGRVALSCPGVSGHRGHGLARETITANR